MVVPLLSAISYIIVLLNLETDEYFSYIFLFL